MELKKIAPGDYILQVIVRDRLAKKDHQIAVQSINFEIRKPKLSSLSPLRSP
jgi:hypothetical protein